MNAAIYARISSDKQTRGFFLSSLHTSGSVVSISNLHKDTLVLLHDDILMLVSAAWYH